MFGIALLLTAVSTGAFTREFRAVGTQNEDCPTVPAPCGIGRLVETLDQPRAGAIDFNRTNVALIGTMAPAMQVAAVAQLIERVREVK